jgi:hypothetical protein
MALVCQKINKTEKKQKITLVFFIKDKQNSKDNVPLLCILEPVWNTGKKLCFHVCEIEHFL